MVNNAASFSCQEIVFTKYNNRKRRTLLSHKILNKQPLLKLWTCQLLIYKLNPRGKCLWVVYLSVILFILLCFVPNVIIFCFDNGYANKWLWLETKIWKQGIKLNYNMYSSKFVTKRNLGFWSAHSRSKWDWFSLFTVHVTEVFYR